MVTSIEDPVDPLDRFAAERAGILRPVPQTRITPPRIHPRRALAAQAPVPARNDHVGARLGEAHAAILGGAGRRRDASTRRILRTGLRTVVGSLVWRIQTFHNPNRSTCWILESPELAPRPRRENREIDDHLSK